MSVRIDHDNSFVTKVYCKMDTFPFNVISLPFLDSNINHRLCYLFFYGQVLRYQRLCTFREDFENRCKMLAEELLNRVYNRGKLGHQFCRVLGKYMAEFQKWQIPLNIPNWFNQILTSTLSNIPPSPQPDQILTITQPTPPNPNNPITISISQPNNPITISLSQPNISLSQPNTS